MFFRLLPSLSLLVARAIVLILAIPIHEYAHAYVAFKMGDSTARFRGRVSLNPFDHLDPVGVLVFMLTGFGWARPVPVNSFYFRDRKKGIIAVSLAGPASNLLLALVSLAVYKLLRLVLVFSPLGTLFGGLAGVVLNILWLMVSANITLAVFNLLPIPPLDGWQVLSALLPPQSAWKIARYEREIGLALIFVVLFTPLLSYPIGWLSGIFFQLMDWMTFFLG